MKKKMLKKIVLIVGGVIVIIVILSLLTGGDSNKSNQPLASTTNTISTTKEKTEAELVNQEFLSILIGINTISLDGSIFSQAGFQALRDFTKEIVQLEDEGRLNPFAPIGTDNLIADDITLEESSNNIENSIPDAEVIPDLNV